MNYDIYIDGFIGQSDFFTDGFSAKTLRDKLASAPAGTDELTIHINSGGGSVIEGFAIHDALKNTGFKVNTSVEGLCGSIATIVAQSNSNGGIRTMNKNSEYFIHNPYWTPDSPTPMEAADLSALAESLQENENRIAEFYASVTGKGIDFIKEKMASTASFTSQEAKDFGFVDEVVGDVKSFQKHLINSNGKEYRFAAFVQTKNNIMVDIKKMFTDFENKISGLLAPKIENEVVKSSEGVSIYYKGSLSEGADVYADESMTTPAPDGVHTVDNKKYTITAGKISKVEEVAAAANLQAEIDTLKTQLAEKETALAAAQTELTKVTAEKTEATTAVETIKTEFVAFKAQFVTGNGELKPEFQSFKGEVVVKKSVAEQVIEYRKAKAEKNS